MPRGRTETATAHWPSQKKAQSSPQEAELEVLSIEGDKALAFLLFGCVLGSTDSSDF